MKTLYTLVHKENKLALTGFCRPFSHFLKKTVSGYEPIYLDKMYYI